MAGRWDFLWLQQIVCFSGFVIISKLYTNNKRGNKIYIVLSFSEILTNQSAVQSVHWRWGMLIAQAIINTIIIGMILSSLNLLISKSEKSSITINRYMTFMLREWLNRKILQLLRYRENTSSYIYEFDLIHGYIIESNHRMMSLPFYLFYLVEYMLICLRMLMNQSRNKREEG